MISVSGSLRAPDMFPSCHRCCTRASLYYLPNTVDTSMLPVDICHLKQTVLIRPLTNCEYQSDQNTRHESQHGFPPLYWPGRASFPPLRAESRSFLTWTKTKRDLRPFCGPLCGFWRPPTFSSSSSSSSRSDECESAATDVHTQFLGLNSSLLKNCVWTIRR